MSFWSSWCQSAIEQWTKNTNNCFTGKRCSHIQHLSLMSGSGHITDFFTYQCWKQRTCLTVNLKCAITQPEDPFFLLFFVFCSDLPCFHFHAQLEGARFPCLANQWQYSAPEVLTCVFINDLSDTTVCLSATAWTSVAYSNWFSDLCK